MMIFFKFYWQKYMNYSYQKSEILLHFSLDFSSYVTLFNSLYSMNIIIIIKFLLDIFSNVLFVCLLFHMQKSEQWTDILSVDDNIKNIEKREEPTRHITNCDWHDETQKKISYHRKYTDPVDLLSVYFLIRTNWLSYLKWE